MKKIMTINGMNCAHCAAKVEQALSDVPGVKTAKVDLKKAQSKVKYDETQVTDDMLIKAVTDAGYAGQFRA